MSDNSIVKYTEKKFQFQEDLEKLKGRVELLEHEMNIKREFFEQTNRIMRRNAEESTRTNKFMNIAATIWLLAGIFTLFKEVILKWMR